MARRQWWERIADALASIGDAIFDASDSQPQPPNNPQPKPKARARRTSKRGPTPSPPKTKDVSRETSDDIRPGDSGQRDEAFTQIMAWFPNDGHYIWDGRSRRYHSSQGESNHPANPHTVSRNTARMDMHDVDTILTVDRETFRQLAAVNSFFHYH